MTGRVDGKVAFITGAARGQGRAHALRLAEEGADIIAVDICAPVDQISQYPAADPADLKETVRQVEALGRRIVSEVVDIREEARLGGVLDAAVAELGGLDIVVANAGVCHVASWDQVTSELFDSIISVNLRGTWNSVRVAIPHLIERGGGSVIMTSSEAGLKGLPFLLPYVASKHAVTGMARALAQELAMHKIRVNSLHPGGVDTPMGDPNATAAFNDLIAKNPTVGPMLMTAWADPMTQPRDQSNAVLFLASDESAFITAAALPVDAGGSQF
jgi:SDR family mycofactocin-dependent oxidoreductase